MSDKLDNTTGVTIQEIYNMLYPVGSHYIGLQEPVIPRQVKAEWELDNSYNNRSIWINNTIELKTLADGTVPKITGSQEVNQLYGYYPIHPTINGQKAFDHVEGMRSTQTLSPPAVGTLTGYCPEVTFNASYVDKVYTGKAMGKDKYGMVRPTAVVVHIWKRKA